MLGTGNIKFAGKLQILVALYRIQDWGYTAGKIFKTIVHLTRFSNVNCILKKLSMCNAHGQTRILLKVS